jgi:hypothetical protein
MMRGSCKTLNTQGLINSDSEQKNRISERRNTQGLRNPIFEKKSDF